MQKYVIAPEQPFGLGLCEKIMPEYLKEAGYKTHIVGKWHLGYYKKEYTPTFRGFDSHTGYLGAMIDFYNHSLTRIVLLQIFNFIGPFLFTRKNIFRILLTSLTVATI